MEARMETGGITLQTLVEGVVLECGMTMADVADVKLDCPEQPTKIIVSFRDNTAVDIDIMYPLND
jgi:hypothetical protein